MEKSASIAVRLPAATKEALEKMAQDDFRTLSSLIEKLVTEAAREKGYLGESGDLRDGKSRPNKGRDK